jgi:uncharacterized membrane protein
MRHLKYLLFLIVIFSILTPLSLKADDQTGGQNIIVKAKVLSVLTTSTETLPGSNTPLPTQSLEAEILSGVDNGKTIVFDNDYVMLKSGDVFYLNSTVQPDGTSMYSVFEPDRVPVLLFFLILFVALVLIFGGFQGLRGLLSLCGSLLVIAFVLLPLILHGFSPLLVSIVVSSLIIILGSYITHGFNKTTSSAVIGMIVTVIITGIMAYFAVHNSQLTGVSGDESIYLNFNITGGIDLVGLLMGGIIIGLLGVLYDVSIGQSIAVEELHNIATHLSRWKIYKRAIRIGREHIGALVNTLAIAYVGASLPLLLLFYSGTDASFAIMINREVFATEIIRILIGSIGLVLAVPVTTLLSVIMLIPKSVQVLDKEQLQKEEKDLKHFHHTH